MKHLTKLIALVLIIGFAGPLLADIDVVVTKNVDNQNPEIGSNVVFTITAHNNGPDVATVLTVYDMLPPNVGHVGSGVTHGFYNFSDGSWSMGGIGNGVTATLVVTGKVSMSIALDADIPNPTLVRFDRFGKSISALGDDKMIIGAYQADPGSSSGGGEAHLISIDGSLIRTIQNPTPSDNDFFGYAVAGLDSERMAISAYQEDISGSDAGIVYIYDTSGSILATCSNPAPTAQDYFGFSVAAVGRNMLAIGAHQDDAGATDAGSVYLFDTNGTLLATINNPSPGNTDHFGYSVAGVGHNLILIGAPQDDDYASDAGAAYLYDTNGVFRAILTNPDVDIGDLFGFSVSGIGNDGLLVSAYADDPGGSTDGGSVYLYDTNGTLDMTFPNPVPYNNDWFGYVLCGFGSDKLIIGSHRKGPSDWGEAYLYHRNGTLLSTLTNPSPYSADYFGGAVAPVGADRFVVGTYQDDPDGGSAWDSGSAYLYSIGNMPSITNTAVLIAATPSDRNFANDDDDAVLTLVNNPPVAIGDSAGTPEDTPFFIDVLANDSEPDPYDGIYITNVSATANASIMIDSVGSSIIYEPNENWFGEDVFMYWVTDGRGYSASASVTVTVSSVNDIPIIDSQTMVLGTTNQVLEITMDMITVTDPDHVWTNDFTMTVQNGGNYTRTGNVIEHTPVFTGALTVPVIVNDGMGDSVPFNLTVWSTHWLDITNGLNGDVTAVSGWKAHNTSIVITASADSGYCFLEWTGDIVLSNSTRNPSFVKMDDGKTITATFSIDSDSDNLPDVWEMAEIGNLGELATDNNDGDSWTTFEEFEMGLHPKMLDVGVPMKAYEVLWDSQSGTDYQLRTATDLSASNWVDIGSSVAGDGGQVSGFGSRVDNNFQFYAVVGDAVTLSLAEADEIRWQSLSGSNYQVQAASTWYKGSWSDDGTPVPGTGGTDKAFISNRNQTEQYYRLKWLVP